MAGISSLVSQVVEKAGEDYEHPLLAKREIKKTGYLIITSDRGLAGAYNSNICKALTEKINERHESKDEIITASIGKQGFYYLKKYNLLGYYFRLCNGFLQRCHLMHLRMSQHLANEYFVLHCF